MKRIVFHVLLILWSFHVNAQQVRLFELVEKAKAYQPNRSQLELIERSTALKLKELSGANLPQSSLSGQASWQSTVTSVPISVPGFSILPPPKDQYKLTLDVQQNIWDGGFSLASKKLEMAKADLQKSQIEAELQQTEVLVTQYFFGVLLANRQAENVTILLNEIKEQLKLLESAFANGIVSKPDILTVKAKQLELEQKLDDVVNQKLIAVQALGLLTHSTFDENTDFQSIEAVNFDVDSNQNPQLAVFKARQGNLNASQQLTKSKYLPKIGLFATGGYGRPGLNFLARDFSPYFIGGLQLKIPLSQFYTGGLSKELQQIEVNKLSIAKQQESFLLANEVKINEQNKQIDFLIEQIEKDHSMIELRSEIVEISKVQLENGTITSTDFLSEFNQVELAQQNLALHEIQLLKSKQNIKLLLGQ